MLGLRYREELHGGFYFFTRPLDERAADLSLDVVIPDVARFGPSCVAELGGPVRLEGFADDPRSGGKLVFDVAEKSAVYELSFTGGKPGSSAVEGGAADALPWGLYRLRGFKQLDPLNLVDSLTLVRASIYAPDAHEIGRATLRFDARGNLGSLLRSFRVTW